MPKSMQIFGWILCFVIFMVTYRIISSQFSASSHGSPQMFICKFIILFYDNGAQKNLKITHNNKLPHYRNFFDNRTDYQVSSKTTDQIYKRRHSTQAEKLSQVLVIFKETIVTFITSK